MPTLYESSRETKTLSLEATDREGLPYRLVITLRKLGTVTMLDYFVSPDEAEEIIRTLGGLASHADGTAP